MTARAPRFRHTPLGVRVVDEWPREMLISRELLEDANPVFLNRCFRTIFFSPINGRARYRIVSRGEYPRSYLLARE
jgi:hypothetical protein